MVEEHVASGFGIIHPKKMRAFRVGFSSWENLWGATHIGSHWLAVGALGASGKRLVPRVPGDASGRLSTRNGKEGLHSEFCMSWKETKRQPRSSREVRV